jgi:hypothetical protein
MRPSSKRLAPRSSARSRTKPPRCCVPSAPISDRAESYRQLETARRERDDLRATIEHR